MCPEDGHVEYKTFYPELKISDRADADDPGEVSGYASTFNNFDSVGERVVKGAFTNSLPEFLSSGFVAWNHDWQAAPIATPIEAYEDDHGLFVKAQFHSTPEAQSIRKIIKERFERGKKVASSIGYQVLADEATNEGRLLKDVRLYEWSLVNQPANTQATMLGSKHGLVPAAMPLADYSDAVLTMVKEFDRRVSEIRDMRAKQGRVLSSANRTRISSLLEALTAVGDDLKTLLAETEPKADPQKARALFVEFQRIEAQFNGVPM